PTPRRCGSSPRPSTKRFFGPPWLTSGRDGQYYPPGSFPEGPPWWPRPVTSAGGWSKPRSVSPPCPPSRSGCSAPPARAARWLVRAGAKGKGAASLKELNHLLPEKLEKNRRRGEGFGPRFLSVS